MIHLKYPRKRGIFFWDELGCLAKSLGFPEGLFYSNFPEDFTEDSGIETADLLHLLEDQICLHIALDRTVNIHTDEWNLSVIRKALTLLQHRLITFEELHAVRVSYQLYESLDTRGMSLDKNTLQRAFKMCGRMISPLKMLHRLKHMQPGFEEEDRIQLYEFLDLLLWCDMYAEFELAIPDLERSKDERNMYKMEDFRQVLSCYDERLASTLDQQYLKQERKFAKERHTSQKFPKDVPPVDPEPRLRQVKYHREKYSGLGKEVGQSESRVHQAKAGYVRRRPVSAPDVRSYRLGTGTPRSTTSRPQSVMDIASPWVTRPSTARSRKSDDPMEGLQFPRPSLTPRPRTSPAVTQVVTPGDRQQTVANIGALKFQMQTIDVKYQQYLNEDMDFLMPGYRQWKENQVKEPTPPPTPHKQVREPRPSQETLYELAYPCYRGPPPTHARTCDARFRGWQKTRGARSNKYILVSPYFSPTNTGQMLHKLSQSYRCDSRQGDFVHRSTSKHGSRSLQRPKTAPPQLSQERRSSKFSQSAASSDSKSGKLAVEDKKRVAKEAEEKPKITESVSQSVDVRKTLVTSSEPEAEAEGFSGHQQLEKKGGGAGSREAWVIQVQARSEDQSQTGDISRSQGPCSGSQEPHSMSPSEGLDSRSQESSSGSQTHDSRLQPSESRSQEQEPDSRSLVYDSGSNEPGSRSMEQQGSYGQIHCDIAGDVTDFQTVKEKQERFVDLGKVGRVTVLEEIRESEAELEEGEDWEEWAEETEDDDDDEAEETDKDDDAAAESEVIQKPNMAQPEDDKSIPPDCISSSSTPVHSGSNPGQEKSVSQCGANTGVRVSSSLRRRLANYQFLVDVLVAEPKGSPPERKGSLKRLARTMKGSMSQELRAKLVAAN